MDFQYELILACLRLETLIAQIDVDLWILKIRNQDPKSQSNRTQNAVDLWIFNMNLSRLVLG